MRALLIQPPFEDFYATPIRLYPLGLSYAAAMLESLGAEVRILDALTPLKKRCLRLPDDFHHLSSHLGQPLFFKSYYRFGCSDEEILRRTAEFAPDWVGISTQFTAYYRNVGELAVLLKRQLGVPLIVGGNHAAAFADEIRRRTPEIDWVCPGPAEETLLQGLREMGLLADPWPDRVDWRFLRPAHHLQAADGYVIGRRRYASLIASRGCPFACEFCSVHNMFGRRITYRPADEVLAEIRWLYRDRGVRIFNFEDDNLTFDRNWCLPFLQSIVEEPMADDLELTAMNGLCYSTLDEQLIGWMARAGFRQLNLSLVSRDERLRAQHRRPRDLRDLREVVAAAQNAGLFVTVYLILGLPGQSYQEARESIDYLLSLGVLVGPSVFYIPPASSLYPSLHLPPEIRDNWNLYRSSAFAVESETMSRPQLLDLFLYVRRQNLLRKQS